MPVALNLLTAAAVATSNRRAPTASSNNVGVTQYKVYRGGMLLGTLATVASYSNNELISGTALRHR